MVIERCDISGWGRLRKDSGFGGPNSDVYGNVLSHCCDDALEIEGPNSNVRVWGNYIDEAMVGVATCPCRAGPVYVFRNVFARSRSWTCPASGPAPTARPIRSTMTSTTGR